MKFSIILFLLILMSGIPAMAELTVIVNESVSTDELSANDVKQIFTGKKRSWGNGDIIVAVALMSGEIHEDFLKKFIELSRMQFRTYWKKLVFTGQAQSLTEFDSEKDLVAFVAGTKGAIGYIDSATPHDNVKAVVIK